MVQGQAADAVDVWLGPKEEDRNVRGGGGQKADSCVSLGVAEGSAEPDTPTRSPWSLGPSVRPYAWHVGADTETKPPKGGWSQASLHAPSPLILLLEVSCETMCPLWLAVAEASLTVLLLRSSSLGNEPVVHSRKAQITEQW